MEALTVIVQLSALVFVLASMLAMGLSLTIPQIVEPLKNVRLVGTALVVNFVVIPLLVWGIQAVLDLDSTIYIGLVLMATAAGAPFLPKLAQAAKGSTAFSVGLMVLLMVVTIAYMPVVLPWMLRDVGQDVTVDAWAIAKSLIVALLIPLAIGLFAKWRWPDMADGLSPLMSQVSTFAVMLLLVGAIVLQWDAIVSLFGTGGVLAIVLFEVAALVVGYLAGGSDPAVRSVMGLGTAQRNLSAALVVGAQNFTDTPMVLTTVVVAGIIGLVILLPAAGELGRRNAEA
jgi:BASS family bile acid:Na+ symporter